MRSTMATLVGRLRELIADTGAAQRFSNDRLEELLDARATLVREHQLDALDSYEGDGGGTGRVYWREVFAPWGDWEDGPTFRDYKFDALTATTEDLKRGAWTFNPSLYHPTVYLTGQTYDLYGSAADALEEWANSEARSFDVQSQGTSYMRSQKVKGLRDQAQELRRRQRIIVGSMVRTDENGHHGDLGRYTGFGGC
jgi:hypothetical protein